AWLLCSAWTRYTHTHIHTHTHTHTHSPHTHTHTHTGILDRQKTKPSSCHVLLFPTHFSNNHYHLSQTGASTACMHMQTHTQRMRNTASPHTTHIVTHTHTHTRAAHTHTLPFSHSLPQLCYLFVSHPF